MLFCTTKSCCTVPSQCVVLCCFVLYLPVVSVLFCFVLTSSQCVVVLYLPVVKLTSSQCVVLYLPVVGVLFCFVLTSSQCVVLFCTYQ